MKKKFRFAKIVLMLVLCLSLTLLTACKPEAQEFTVSFDSDGGSVVSSQTVEKGESINLPVPEKQGFVFVGWYENELKVATPFVVNKDTSLKAKWSGQTQTFVITFDTDGGEPIAPVTKAKDSQYTLPVPVKQNFDFVGWYLNEVEVASPYTVTADVTLVAKWQKQVKLNPASNYNYYDTKYSLSKESKIVSINFSDFDQMFTMDGNWLIYLDSENGSPRERFEEINNCAHRWGVTIYHFNPDLAGGFASYNQNAHTTNLLYDLDYVAGESYLAKVKARFEFFLSLKSEYTRAIVDYDLLAVKAEQSRPAYINNEPVEMFESYISYFATYGNCDKVVASIATLKPGCSSTSVNPADYETGNINTYNTYADQRWHIYANDFKGEKQDVFVNLANYGQFAHLLNNCQGTFVVIFGGIWCPNSSAIAKLTNDLAKDYGIDKIYCFDPRLDGGTRINRAVVSGNDVQLLPDNTFLAQWLQTRNNDSLTETSYNFNYLYATLMSQYFPGYTPQWQGATGQQSFLITSNGVKKNYARIFTPTVMLFEGGGNADWQLIDYVDAEYYWEDISKDNSAEAKAWTDALKDLFDQHEYAIYDPLTHAPAVEQGDYTIVLPGVVGGSSGGYSDDPNAC